MSDAERALLTLIGWENLPKPVAEYRFAPPRRWRFDFAWPDQHLAIEIDGGAFVSGRHTRGLGFEKDTEKLNEALIAGWRVLRVTPGQVYGGEATAWIKRALA